MFGMWGLERMEAVAHLTTAEGERISCYARRESPGHCGIVVNRLFLRRTALITGMMVLGTCGAGGQAAPVRDPPPVAQKTLAPLRATDPVVREGLFSIDVVVTDAAGNPVSDLAPWDFTLLDNSKPAKIRTFHNALAASEPAPELIFVLDTVNLSPQQLTQTESAISRLLRRDNGRLEFPCFLYRLTRDGLFSSLRPVMDGTLLVNELEQKRSQWTVWSSGGNDELILGRSLEGRSQHNPLSLRALGSIAIDRRDIPGRKVLVWIGPGWPVNGGEVGFDEATELSTRLREARITLDNVNVWPNPDPVFNYRDYLKPPRSQKEMQPAKLALPVIATQTGGLVLDSSGDQNTDLDRDLDRKLDRDIARCVAEMRSFYTLTFNPPHTYTMDEFNDLRVQVDRPALTVRAPTGYYNEPVYFDNPRPGIEKVTVAQVEELVHAQTDLLRKVTNPRTHRTAKHAPPRCTAEHDPRRTGTPGTDGGCRSVVRAAAPARRNCESPASSGGGTASHPGAHIRLPAECHSQTA